jgi:uncharacterized protein
MDLSWVVGRHKTFFLSSETTISLSTRSGKSVSLREVIESTTPPCRLNPFLFNGHLQTVRTALKAADVPIYYKRKVLEAEDPTFAGSFAVDFVTEPYDGSDTTLPPRTTYFTEEEFSELGSEDSRPMLVCLHGLSGGSYELYLRHCLAPLVGKTGGWEACVVNSRGCARSKITSSILYNARATWDIRQTVKWIRKKFPNRPLFGLGFSLGANILTNVRTCLELPRERIIVIINNLSIVRGRGRGTMHVPIRSSLLKSFQPRCRFSCTSKDVAGLGSVLEGNGYEHEEAL